MKRIILTALFYTISANSIFAQHRQDIVGKTWYAVKVTGGSSDESNQLAPEEYTSEWYIFKWEIKTLHDAYKDGIKSSKMFDGRNPSEVQITGNTLKFLYSGSSTASDEFAIIACTRDFLQLKGSKGERYFLISNDMHTDEGD